MTLIEAIQLSRYVRKKHWAWDKYHYFDELDYSLNVPGTEIKKTVITLEEALYSNDWEPYYP